MARLKFHRDFTHPIDENRRRTWPQDWEGDVDDAIAATAVAGGLATCVGAPPAPPSSPVEIPADWEELSAADLVALAHKLGAGGEVSTKADAAAFVGKIAAERAGQKPLV